MARNYYTLLSQLSLLHFQHFMAIFFFNLNKKKKKKIKKKKKKKKN
jgi:preprotein translocase subunit YajC